MKLSQGVFSCPDTALVMIGEDPAGPKAVQGTGAKGVRARSGGAHDQLGSRNMGCAYLGGTSSHVRGHRGQPWHPGFSAVWGEVPECPAVHLAGTVEGGRVTFLLHRLGLRLPQPILLSEPRPSGYPPLQEGCSLTGLCRPRGASDRHI